LFGTEAPYELTLGAPSDKPTLLKYDMAGDLMSGRHTRIEILSGLPDGPVPKGEIRRVFSPETIAAYPQAYPRSRSPLAVNPSLLRTGHAIFATQSHRSDLLQFRSVNPLNRSHS
jgi:hypothetical protein